MKHFLLFVLLLTCAVAQAEDASHTILVDLERVVEAGKAEPVDGMSSAGQPDRAALDVFAKSGYATIIDMRGPDEDRGIDNFESVVESLGMHYVAFPIVDEEDISFEKAGKLDALIKASDGPVLLHCKSGNRVGAMLALRQSLAGADEETAIRYGRDAGMTRLEPIVRKVLEKGPDGR